MVLFVVIDGLDWVATALGAGVIRDSLGTSTRTRWGGAALCAITAVLSIVVTGAPDDRAGESSGEEPAALPGAVL